MLSQRTDESAKRWALISATAINNLGQIVGYGTNPSGNQEAFLLNPTCIPEAVVNVTPSHLTVEPGAPVTLNAQDPCGRLLLDWGEGSSLGEQIITKTFTGLPNVHPVTLTITNPEGPIATRTYPIRVGPPHLNGYWKHPDSTNKVIFLFGDNLQVADNTLPKVSFNGIPSYAVQPLTSTLLLAIVPPGDTQGYITVETQAGTPKLSLGTTQSPTPYIPPSTSLGINGLWPSQGPIGTFVFVFGSGFVPDATQVRINNLNASLVQVIDANLLIFKLPANATSGPTHITTSAGTVSSSTNFTVTP